eukprot:GFYU01001380.1.p1 GENE.GFYU01001380.1~~GFYU01001380.1.p1  ORF type:complete len:245 (+),score=36.56 GFYU01001380.1:235-969(+)
MGGAVSVVSVETSVYTDDEGVARTQTRTHVLELDPTSSNAGRAYTFTGAATPLMLGAAMGGSAGLQLATRNNETALVPGSGPTSTRRTMLCVRNPYGPMLHDNADRIQMLAETLMRVLDEMDAVEKPKCKGAPEDVIDSIPVRKYSKVKSLSAATKKLGVKKSSGVRADNEECYICLDPYSEGEMVRTLPCNHEYHQECVDKWLGEVHSVCPLCRSDICEQKEGKKKPTSLPVPSDLPPLVSLE